MTTSSLLRTLPLLVIGAGAGALAATRLAQSASPMPPSAETTTLQADVAHLKDIIPGQSHAMIDVGYHMANLWFAVERKNWAFAAFEVDETRNRIRWTIRINPVRKDPEGKPVDLKSIFDAIDTTSMTSLKQAVEKKDIVAFGAAYRQMLESCYACHKASGKPYLRPAIPSVPPQSIMNYDPGATWPE
jgi:hypothetical protein